MDIEYLGLGHVRSLPASQLSVVADAAPAIDLE
jgi:hypothetical protein